MRIAMISTPFEDVPPQKYGGTERVVHFLTEKLVAKGHDVTLYSTATSRTSAKLCAIMDRPVRPYSNETSIVHASLVAQHVRKTNCDIIHSFHDAFVCFAHALSQPCIFTLENDDNLFFDPFPNAQYVAVSNNQASRLSHRNIIDVIHNGINLSEMSVCQNKKGYLAFLGGLTPRKGCHIAIQVALKTGRELIIAGNIYEHRTEYFQNEIVKYVDGDRIKYIGELNNQDKYELLRHADATLFPIEWNEPFGLVMVESLACGTPVIAYKRGSVPEVLGNNQVASVVDNFEDMCNAVMNLDTLKFDPLACRQYAVNNYSDEIMADRYVELYERVINNRSTGGHEPQKI